MAACGLQPGRKGSIPGHNGFGDTRYSRNSTSIGIPNDKSKYDFQTIFKQLDKNKFFRIECLLKYENLKLKTSFRPSINSDASHNHN